MSESRQQARDFIADVKAGMSDEDLRIKYELSERRLVLCKASALDVIAKERAREFRAKRKIDAPAFLADVKSGVSHEDLMAKYSLTRRELQSVFRQIIEAGLATVMELSEHLSVTESQVREAFREMGKAISELD